MTTFAPHLYAKVKDINSTQSFMEIFDPVAIATILLAAATFALVKDSSKNIEISKNNLLEEHLVKEMEKLIKPLYKNRDELEYYELVHAFAYKEAQDFLSDIEANKYLAHKELRILIESYLKINREEYDKYTNIKGKVWQAYFDGEAKNGIEIYRDFERLPTGDKYEHILYYEMIVEKFTKPGSDLRKSIQEFIKLIKEDTNLKSERSNLQDKVIDRYNELEKKIEEIRDALEKSK